MNNIRLNFPGSRPQALATGAPVGSARDYLAECESLRGVAILLVMLFHGYLQVAASHALQPGLLSGFIMAGNTGVTLFFVLSGFLLNLPFLRNQSLSPGSFFRNRALRILPMYIPVVVIAGIYRQDLASAIQALLFWNLDIRTLWPFGTVWWSLMVEVQFYLLLPCLYALARTPRLRVLLYPLFAAGCLLYLLYTNRLPWQPKSFYFIADPRDSIICLWPVFFVGGILAWLHSHRAETFKQRAATSRILANGGSDVLLLVLLLALGATLREVAKVGPFAARAFYFDHVLLEAVLWAAIIAALLYLPLKTKILWSNPILNFFGIISYSLYLLHAWVMNLGLKFIGQSSLAALSIPKPLLIAGLFGLAIALSMLTYAMIERPALKLKRTGTRPQAQPAENSGMDSR